MPNIKDKNENATFARTKPSLNVQRDEVFYREDLRTTFTYAIIAASVLAVIASVGYLGIQQLRK